MTRLVPFVSVGALGLLVQISALALFSTAGWPVALATAAAVEVAVLHNFCWHQLWTWRDRGRRGWASRIARFHLTTGLTSILGNIVITASLAHALELGVIAANVSAVALVGLVNFLLADRVVFSRVVRRSPPPSDRRERTSAEAKGRMGRQGMGWAWNARWIGTGALTAWALGASAATAGPARQTVAAWNAYVAEAEAGMVIGTPAPCDPGREPEGQTVSVPGGTIHRWRGCTILSGYTVEALLDALENPGTPPPQEDILESRVLARSDQSLRVYLKLRRRAIVTVTYDTEHEVRFARSAVGAATSRSVATSIVETGGDDRGFLWRLNAYWRYVQTGPDVRIELESLSLSRTVPMLLRPVASPVISGVARESVTRALEAIRQYRATN